MDDKGTIRAAQGVISSFLSSNIINGWDRGGATAEEFAQKRFLSKLERPDKTRTADRREACWREWIESDNQLEPLGFYKPEWARAKLFIARILKGFRLGSVSFTNGSEFIATFGYNSVEHKLNRSIWTCTPGNFDLWCRIVYKHHGLKVAMRKRWLRLLAERGWNRKQCDRILWSRFRNEPDPGYSIFCFKLDCLTQEVQGNRFSTVPKNNLKDRPICIEPLANILTQRCIGIGIRSCLRQHGLDLNDAAQKHRIMISANRYATIDLKNASDRISLKLVKYLLPSKLFNMIEQARSEMTLGLDDDFHIIQKVSSMGNGFTFELMSLILYALCKAICDDCSVFGDDIIVPHNHATTIIELLESVCFIVNRDKTHINDGYRESCGAHFIDGHGYVESYDFRWPENIGDVITSYNKLVRLASVYPSFRIFRDMLYRAMPTAMHAHNILKAEGVWHRSQDPLDAAKLDTFCVTQPFQFRNDGIPLKRRHKAVVKRFCSDLYLDPRNASLQLGYEWVDRGSKPTDLTSSQWAKKLMYLASGRRCTSSRLGSGAYKSFLVVTLSDGTTFRWSDLVAIYLK